LRRAELGFLGVDVYTRMQTPRRCGHRVRAGAPVLDFNFSRPNRTSWLMVGIEPPELKTSKNLFILPTFSLLSICYYACHPPVF